MVAELTKYARMPMDDGSLYRSDAMIYLLNSGFARLYLTNILNTLFLPRNSRLEYRYSVSRNVSSQTADKLGRLSGQPVAVVYVDRYAAGTYTYYPIRLGTLTSAEELGGMLHITFRNDRLVFPKDPAAFSKSILEEFSHVGIARLTDNDPDNEDDGEYVIVGKSLFDPRNSFLWDDRAWSEAVAKLRQTKVLKSTPERPVVFAQARLIRSSRASRTDLSTEQIGGIDRYVMSRGDHARVEIGYTYPALELDRNAVLELKATPGDNVQLLAHPSWKIAAPAARLLVPFRLKRRAEEEDTMLRVEFAPVLQAQSGLLAPDATFLFRIATSKRDTAKLLAALIVFGFLSALLGADVPEGSARSLENIFKGITIPSAILSAAQMIVLYILFRLTGEKFA